MKFNVLVTSSGTVTSQGVIKGLRMQNEFDYKLVTTDMNESNAGRYFGNMFYKLPGATKEEYIPSLLDICKKEEINLLIPIYDKELLVVAKNKEKFKAIGCYPLISDPETILTCNDKYLTYQFFRKHGVKTPETYPAEEIMSGRAKIDYPAFMKPAGGIAAIGTSRVNNFEELKAWAKKIEEPLVQSLLSGREYSIDVLADLEKRVIEVVPRTRDETRHGASTKGITEKNFEIINNAKYIAEKLGIIGPCNIQCFKSDNGEINFFEVNPRFSAAHAHSIAAGMNSPHLLLKMLDGQKVEPRIGQFQDGLRMYRYWAEVFTTKEGSYIGGSKL